jgi:chromosome segregation protein
MYQLKRAHLVQFFLFQAETLELDLTTAIIAPNGAGKSALLDALQIVMLGADRNQIRFNAQAGGSHRARTIRDYCLGVYRSGDEGRTRETATTYISLVFENLENGETLSAGISLGASAQEPDHRVHGMYLLPDVALALEDHLETLNGQVIPLEWSRFRELAVKRCKAAGTKLELHATSDRFVKDMLARLRPSNALLDPQAYRKAFQNALNLQRVSDVDLFVRTLVAEERPTEIAKFRALLEGFRQIKEKIEQVAKRIDDAETIEAQYRRIASQATRAASYRALAAEYERDQHSEALDAAEDALNAAANDHQNKSRALQQARSDRETSRLDAEEASKRLQGMRGFHEQASAEAITTSLISELNGVRRELLRGTSFVREQLAATRRVGLSDVDAVVLREALAPWDQLHALIQSQTVDAPIELDPQNLHAQLQQAIERAQPLITQIKRQARERQNALDQAHLRARTARQNQARISAGQAELRADVVRLMSYLSDEGIPARPVCDLVQVKDPAWQRAIEAYLRTHVEALLIPAQYEQAAVRLYRSLHGARSVYGVKLALSSQARANADSKLSRDHVAALLTGDDEDALAYLRRQLGDLRCIESDAEVVRTRHGLSQDGLVTKGGGVERLRLPGVNELKIGASDNRERLRQLREEIESSEREARELEQQAKSIGDLVTGLARIEHAQELANHTHELLLRHREACGRLRAHQRSIAAQSDPDLMRSVEELAELESRKKDAEARVDELTGQTAVAEAKVASLRGVLDALNQQTPALARRATEAFAHEDVDPNLVEQQRAELDEKYPELNERRLRCIARAEGSEKELSNLTPDAWSGLSQYAKDYSIDLNMEAHDWRKANTLLRKEIAHLKNSELVDYQNAADEAYRTSVDTFRSNVASALYDNFTRLKQQIATLNRTLQRSPAFSNDERYQFRYEVAPEFKELHRFINKAADVGETDTLFGSAGEVPDAFRDIVEDKVAGRAAGAASPLDDYRRFFNFEVTIKQGDKVIGNLSERMRSGSGGEHRAPLYVIAGAALAAAYGKSDGNTAGLGVIMLDEFGDKIDAQNARSTTNYLRSLGLQLILAAPDTAQGTLTGVLDSYVELFRDGSLLQVERTRITDKGRELLASDQFAVHPELLDREIERLREATTANSTERSG